MRQGPILRRVAVAWALAAWMLLLAALFAPLAAAESTTVGPAEPPAGATPTMIDLAGPWKFAIDWDEGGLKAGWEKPDFKDTAWRDLNVPGAWEEQGITKPNPRWPSTTENDGYNGYAWYRRHVQIPAAWKEGQAVLRFGGIDDLDWTYVNGTLVGSTTQSGQDKTERDYEIPAGVLRPGADNVIAVRVCDTGGLGGIVSGPAVLSFTPRAPVPPAAPAPPAPPSPPGVYTQQHNGDLNRMGGSVDVPADMEVLGNVSAVGGSANISGHVTGNVSAVGGSVILHAGARVDGQVISVGGRVVREDGSVVGGATTELNGIPSAFIRRAFEIPRFRSEGSDFFGISSFLRTVLLWGFIALLAALLLPRRLEVMARALPLLPGRAAIYGTLGLIVTPAALVAAILLGAFIIVILAITIVGILAIPAVPAAWAGLGLAVIAFGVLGSLAVMLSLGQAIVARFRPDTGHTVAAAVIGAVVIAALCTLPVIGILVFLTVMIFGYGLALMTGLGSEEEWATRHVFRRHPLQLAPAEGPTPPGASPSPTGPTRIVARPHPPEQPAPPPSPPTEPPPPTEEETPPG